MTYLLITSKSNLINTLSWLDTSRCRFKAMQSLRT